MKKHFRLALAAVAVIALAGLVAGCGSSSKNSSNNANNSTTAAGSSSSPVDIVGAYDNGNAQRGGTWRVGIEQSFGFTNNFDPTGEYLGTGINIYSNLLIRTLAGYKHVAGAEGNQLVGDLATHIPTPTDGGLTYTYKLRTGVKFSPPVNRAVTSKDVVTAMQRLANPKDGGQYAFYYTVIKGWNDYAAGKAKTISGISTPDDHTIVFHLTQPTGDFNYRMSMPATGPIPEEITKCFEGKPGNYGRNVVSSGPYMIQGSDKVDISSCSTIKPAAGYDGANGSHLILVRNPNYNQATDPYRKNYPDKFIFTVDSNADDIYNKVMAGQLEDELASQQPKTIRQYITSPDLRKRLLPNIGDRTWYLTMNMTQPPFDDIHIRKAMNFIMDKKALQKAWGGPVVGSIATHIVPPVLYNNGLAEYDPFATKDSAGDVAKAAAEVKQSKYDPGKTGKCTASACKRVLMIADVRAVDNRMIPVIQASAAKIGITFTVRQINGAYTTIQTTSKNIPFSERPGWGKDFADPYAFIGELFSSAAIIPTGNTNYSLVGVTRTINRVKKLGLTGNLDNVPSVDSNINECEPKVKTARIDCWEGVDKTLMTKVVPWVPYLWANNVTIVGPKVTHWQYDQYGDYTAYSQVAVKQ